MTPITPEQVIEKAKELGLNIEPLTLREIHIIILVQHILREFKDE